MRKRKASGRVRPFATIIGATVTNGACHFMGRLAQCDACFSNPKSRDTAHFVKSLSQKLLLDRGNWTRNHHSGEIQS
jgi:hypothetical protein